MMDASYEMRAAQGTVYAHNEHGTHLRWCTMLGVIKKMAAISCEWAYSFPPCSLISHFAV